MPNTKDAVAPVKVADPDSITPEDFIGIADDAPATEQSSVAQYQDFLCALCGGVTGDFIVVEGPDGDLNINVAEAAQFIGSQDASKYRLSPVINKELAFFVGVEDSSDPDFYKSCSLPPSVAMFDGSRTILCYTLETPLPLSNPEVQRLMEFFGMVPEEAIPLPGEKWRVLRADPDTFYTLDQLSETYFADAAAKKTYGDAKVITPYNEADHAEEIWVTYGTDRKSMNWVPKKMPRGAVIAKLCQHLEGKKDGPALVFAEMVPGQRLKNAVKASYAIGIDEDTGTPASRIDYALEQLGCCAVRYTTHSNGTTRTQFRKDEVLKKFPEIEEVDTEVMQRYCRDIEKWYEALIPTIEVKQEIHESHGIMVEIEHAPIDKNRIVVFLKEPYDFSKEGRTQQEAMKKFAKLPAMLADHLQVPLDKSCVDPSRLFYTPRHAPGTANYSISLFGGPLFDWRTLKPSFTEALDEVDKFLKGKQSKSVTQKGRELGRWSWKRGGGFQIADVINEYAPDKVRGGASLGITIECPFDEGHSNAGNTSDTACFAVNAAEGGNEWPIVSCRHGSCQEYTVLDMIGKMLEDEWFGEDVLTDERFNALVLEDETQEKPREQAKEKANDEAKDEPKQDAHEEAELLPDLAELKARIAKLSKTAERDEWLPVLDAILGARLNPTDHEKALEALVEHITSLKRKVLNAEIKARKSEKQSQGPDEKAVANSNKLKRLMDERFGNDFHLPNTEKGPEVHLAMVDGRPWFCIGEELQLCTPFVLDGTLTYPDKNSDCGIRIRILNGKNEVVSVEFEAALLGPSNGNQVISAMRAKGWVCTPEIGRELFLGYVGSQQRSGPTVFHRSGYRDGVFVLATGAVIAPKNYKGSKVELHPSARLKGLMEAGTFEGWKAGAKKVFSNPDAWHYQLGTILGLEGPVSGYLDLDSMLAYFGGDSRHGKTFSQRSASAHYGPCNEKEGRGYFVNAKGTRNSRENILQRSSCAVACFDEFGKRPAKEQAEFAFDVQGGSGCTRMGRDTEEKATRHWHGLCVIVSAEKTLGQMLAAAGETFDVGMTARMLPINMSGTKWLEGEDWGAVLAMHENYGHSGPAFIRALVEMDSKKLADRFEAIIDDLPDTKGTDSRLRRSAAGLVARIPLVAELMVKAGLIPEGYDAMPLAKRLWREFLASDTAPIDPATRAMETLISNLHTRKGSDVVHFNFRHELRSKEPQAYFSVPTDGGKNAPKEGEPSYYVVQTKCLSALSGSFATEKALLAKLESENYLVRPSGARGKKRTWTYIPNLGRFPCVVLDAVVVDDAPEEPEAGGGEESQE